MFGWILLGIVVIVGAYVMIGDAADVLTTWRSRQPLHRKQKSDAILGVLPAALMALLGTAFFEWPIWVTVVGSAALLLAIWGPALLVSEVRVRRDRATG